MRPARIARIATRKSRRGELLFLIFIAIYLAVGICLIEDAFSENPTNGGSYGGRAGSYSPDRQPYPGSTGQYSTGGGSGGTTSGGGGLGSTGPQAGNGGQANNAGF